MSQSPDNLYLEERSLLLLSEAGADPFCVMCVPLVHQGSVLVSVFMCASGGVCVQLCFGVLQIESAGEAV